MIESDWKIEISSGFEPGRYEGKTAAYSQRPTQHLSFVFLKPNFIEIHNVVEESYCARANPMMEKSHSRDLSLKYQLNANLYESSVSLLMKFKRHIVNFSSIRCPIPINLRSMSIISWKLHHVSLTNE